MNGQILRMLVLIFSVIVVMSACTSEEDGCTDPEAVNFNPDATEDDGSCEYEGCKDEAAINYDPDADVDDGSCTYPAAAFIDIHHKAGNEALQLDERIYENEAGNVFSVARLRYFISDMTFIEASGETHTIDDLHYRDVQDDDTRVWEIPEMPEGAFVGIQFVFGLDEEKNISYKYADNQTYQTMEWPEQMGGGYHYMQMEGVFLPDESSTDERFYNTHTGRVVYQGESGEDSALHENYVIIEIDNLDFTVQTDEALHIDLYMDVLEWYQNPEIYDFSDYNGIMNYQPAQELLRANGKDAFGIDNIYIE